MNAQIATNTLKHSYIKSGVLILRIFAFLSSLVSIAAVIAGCLTLASSSNDTYFTPFLYIQSAILAGLFFAVRFCKIQPSWGLMITSLSALISAIIVNYLPAYLLVSNINGIIHHSLVSGLLLLAVAIPGACYSLFYALGASPRAFDVSRYPFLALVGVLALFSYGLIIFFIIQNSYLNLSWSILTTPFTDQLKIIEEWKDGWPLFSSIQIRQVGMANHILGTLLLMGLTTMISLPIGVGVGVFVREYAGPKLAWIVNFSTTALRSISGIIMAVTAITVISLAPRDSFLFDLIHGFGYDINGFMQSGRSSYLFASLFISLLVIPIVARATQEGLNSLPHDIKEGSLAIGASKEHTLFHLQIPWSIPNVITGLMLGCAEAAGALTLIFLISGTGEYGVGPLHETTSLAFLIFDCRYGREMGHSTQDVMGNYQYTAALVLLVITVGLTIAALIMKKSLAKRYKGA